MELSVTEAFEQIKAWAIAAADAEDPRPLLENIVSACDMKLSWQPMKVFETKNLRIEVQDHLIKANENVGYCIIQNATGRTYLPFEELGQFIDEILNVKLGLTEYKEDENGVHKIK